MWVKSFLFKMYRTGHRVFRYKTFFAYYAQEAIECADTWAGANGYVDFELVSENREGR